MKLRVLLSIVFALTIINGWIAVYRALNTPPSNIVSGRTPSANTATPPSSASQDSSQHSSMVPDQVAEKQNESSPAVTPPADKAPGKTAMLDKNLRPAPRLPESPLSSKYIADRVLVEKQARRLTLFRNNKPLKTYEVALGQQPDGPKRFMGDNKTPEGRYVIDSRKQNSSYHRALHISYPSVRDVAFAAQQGRSPGGSIMIHGLPNGMGALGPLHRLRDWTAGCIAVTNTEIEELWRAIPDGTPIEIRP